ncbi:toll-like receptor 6 [Mya arenaria]|uniref:toll-like receptor 6 n=1 Tax=Mya arenaria TaxID=6604 RepID=UPI0022E086DB|nr:toll-like receptor 6 [Mya arenaria]XP_052762398.1 toll-like receptor 6 [Mya arenaria]
MIGREYLTVAMVAVLVVTSTRVQSAEEVTNNVTFTYRTTGEGNVSLTYPRNEASECIFDKRIGTLTCTDNKSFNNTTRVWNNEPASIKYIKINCKLDGAYRKQCYCINGTTGFRPCHLRRLDLGVLANLTNLEVLDLSYNRLDTIQTEALQGLRNLKFVSFRFNYLKAFPTGLFCPSPVLKYLDIGSNPLKSYPYGSMLCKTDLEIKVLEVRNSTLDRIPDNALKNLTSLERFDLSFNPITSVTKRAFDGGKSLTELDLSDCDISDLFPYFCDYLPNMTNLYLQNNRFKRFDFEDIVNCTALKMLNISGNHLTVVQGEAVGLISIEHIDFSRNQVNVLNTTFKGLQNLKHLHLQDNVLDHLVEGQFEGASNLVYVNLANNMIHKTTNFTKVFTMVNLTHLHLAQNKITILENESFTALRNLEVLDLGGNTIHTLRNEMLAGLSSLKQLKIYSNRLEGIVNNTFGGLASLEILNIAGNKLASLEQLSLNGLSKLQELNLNDNALQRLPAGVLPYPTSLKVVRLANNNISTMGTQRWPPLKEFYIQQNHLTEVPTDINFTDMQIFNASYNNIASFSGALEVMITIDMSHNVITELSYALFNKFKDLSYMNFEHNLLEFNLHVDMFPDAHKIKYLNFAHNKNISVQGHIFATKSLETLEVLNLSANALHSLTALSGPNFEQSSLKILDVSKCQISRIAGDTFTGLTKLEHVDLRHNMVVTFPPLFSGGWTIYDLLDNPITCACTMTWLAEPNVTVGNHNVSVGNFKIPKCKVYTENATYYPHNLRRHQFMCPENNTCDTKCACFKLVQNGDVHLVKCRNGLQEVPVFIPSTTNSLFLDGNNFTSITALYPLFNFTAMKTVELYMNGSEIQTVIPDMFKPFTKLEILSLAYNKIVNIPPGIFRNNNILRQLYLQHNEIRSIEVGAFQDLPALKELDLSGNHLTVLVPATVRELLALPASQYYFLTGNPWKCDCMAVAFKEFVDQERAKIRDRRTLGCDKGKEIVNVPKSKFTCSAEDEGSFGGKSAIIVGVIAGIAVFLVVMATCCYFRRELFSLLFFKTGCRIPGKKRVSGKHFDVLVNYDPTDEQCAGYVQRILLPKLKNNSYSIETSQHVIQDFEVTKRLLEDSRCSIFVIDKNFSSNAFLGQVFLAADKLQKHTKGHSVILLIHGDIDLMALEPEVMSHMRKGDYITARSRLWWERLVYELPDATSGFRPRADTADDEDVVVFSSLAEDQYEQI